MSLQSPLHIHIETSDEGQIFATCLLNLNGAVLLYVRFILALPVLPELCLELALHNDVLSSTVTHPGSESDVLHC